MNPLSKCLIAAIPAWRNLVAITIVPIQAPEGLFVELLRLLQSLQNLRTLKVNSTCTDSLSASALSQIVGLRSLTVIDPNRAILDLFPDWLSRLHGTLRELHLLENCGSITPGVLQTIQPFAAQLRSVSLGLSYSLEDGHVLQFLSQLPYLQNLQLRYYWQMKQPPDIPRITSLRKVVVNHRYIEFQDHVHHLSRWVRRITSQSRLEHLELAVDDFEYFRGPYLNYGGLMEHVSYKHGGTIRVLRLMHGYIDSATVTLLCQKCLVLEEASIGVNITTLREFPYKASSLSKLRQVAFRVCNTKSSKVLKDFTDGAAIDLFGTLKHANLRHLVVNSTAWEGRWITDEFDGVKFIVERQRSGRELGSIIS